MRNARYLLSALLTVGLAAGAIGYTWYTAERTTDEQQAATSQRADALVTSLAASYGEQINRQILALDQTLADLARDYEADPRRFNMEQERENAPILNGISRDMLLADENGIIRQSSVSDVLGQSVRELDAFRVAAETVNDKPKLYLGSASVNRAMRQWHLDAARTLRHPDGSFAGIILAEYRLSAINDVFSASPPPGNGFAALIDLTDGKVRDTFGSVTTSPDASIADTPMFGAVDATESGLWIGPSATDAVVRVHAFRRIQGRDLAVIAGVDQQEVLQPVTVWRWQSREFGGAISGLVVLIALLLLAGLRGSRRRDARDREVAAQFAQVNALAEVSRARADAVNRRLQATFSAVMDGVAIFDPHLNLVEWNGLFPERSGVNASFVRTGMPMEDVLRTQAEAGCFGPVGDIDAEVERRVTLLRAGNFGSAQSLVVHDRSLELRCRSLPEGGFVALYTDVTEGRRARQALRDAREELALEQSDRMRFLNVIAFELRARVAVLMRTLSRARGMMASGAATNGVPAALEQSHKRIRAVGEALANLATDIVEVPEMQSGGPPLSPELLNVRDLLREAVDTIEPAASDRAITTYLVVNERAPAELIADPARVRQIVTLLLSEALRIATPDTMWLLADAGEHDDEALRITIRGFGAPATEEKRAGMFPMLDAVAAPDRFPSGEDPDAVFRAGTMLGAAIARHLALLMGGDLRCAAWSTMDGRTGNDFILSLPPDLLPGQRGRAPGQVPAEGKLLPRTRVLLIGDPTGLRMAAVTMLRRDGHMVETVANAEEAIPLLDNEPYDVVFMDTEAAGKSVELTLRAIRDTGGPARGVPLVLLAPPHEDMDARVWRDAGADDILPHDPTLDDLVGAISRDVWHSRAPLTDVGFMPGLEEDTEEGVPILAADRIAELQANIPPEDLLDMVEECISDLFHRLPALRRSLAASAPGAISAQAHAMVGMAGGYGMAVLEARLRAVLTAVRARKMDTIDGAAAVIEADLTRAAAALRRTLQPSQPAHSGVRT